MHTYTHIQKHTHTRTHTHTNTHAHTHTHTQTHTHTHIHTQAPEQFEGHRTSEKVDQYAFGVLLWELLTGQQPWQELDHPMQIIFAVGVQGQRLPVPDACPALMSDLLHACWDESPDGRPAFAVLEEQLRKGLEELSLEERRK